jgi:stearoyl-CoA desaturase (delta-9 desaturase)
MSATATVTATKAKERRTSGSRDGESFIPLYCYRKRKLPVKDMDEATYTAILEALPREVYEPNWTSAIMQLLTAVLLTVASILTFVNLPWVFTPLGWVLAAFALIHFFNIGHDCAHMKWTPSSLINNIAGEISCLLLLHPFQSFKYQHAHDERLLKKATLENNKQQVATHAPSLIASLGLRGFFAEHYSTKRIPAQYRQRAQLSIVVSIVFNALFFGALYHYHGVLGPVVYWLVPLILYKDILYFRWLEFARRNLDVHFESRIAQSIPSYNLRDATACVSEVLERGNKAKEAELVRIHDDAQMQKTGAKQMGYDHEYGEKVPSKRFKNFGELLKQLNWVNVTILFGLPIISLVGLFSTPLRWQTALLAFVYYFFTGLGITAGYHRLWAHRSYQASPLVELFLMLGGTGALQGSIKWWCGGHRVHHRYTDTPKDPYNAKAGFWFAHMGWMLVKPDPAYKVKADIRDLRADPMINFQHTQYFWLGPLVSLVVPTLIAGLGWGDYWGGYFFAGALRQVFVHHSTFCVNSVAHWFGDHTYDDARTPRDSIVTAFLTLGEGYHNFHHEFPNDYRNGIRAYDYDPTKWLIKFFSLFGLTFNLKEFPANEVLKGKILMKQKFLDREKAKLVFPGPTYALPVFTWAEIQEQVEEGVALTVIDGLVHDVTNFVEDHPGGKAYIGSAVGKDATAAFKGETGVYKHSNAAKHLLTTFRVGRLAENETGARPEHKAQEGAK